MNQFPNIPNSVKEDIRKRAEERFKFLPNEDRDEATAHWNGLVFSQQSGYVIALCEAWEMMDEVYSKGYNAGRFDYDEGFSPELIKPIAKQDFLNQIFKR